MTTQPEIVGYLDERDLDVMPRDLAELLQGEERFPFKTPLIRLADYEALQAEYESLRAKTGMSLGVGDGTGNLFVHGDCDSIKRVQALINECEKLRKDAKRYVPLNEAIQRAAAQGEPVGKVMTVGGYPDESEHTVHWLCKYKDLKDGDCLYTAPQPSFQLPDFATDPDDSDEGASLWDHGFKTGWNSCLEDVAKAMQSAEQQPAPDVSGLTEALRQYQHNDGSGPVFGYDKLLVDQHVAGLVEALHTACEYLPIGSRELELASIALAAHRKGGGV